MALVTDKLIFVHVPKTGGSTVRAVLTALCPEARESGHVEGAEHQPEKHWGLPQVAAAHPELLHGRLPFAFVRHPVSWLKSRWAWAMHTGFGPKMATEAAAAAHWLASCWSEDFTRFVDMYLERRPGEYTRQVMTMLGYWTPPLVSYIGRSEDLVAHLMNVAQVAGQPLDLGAVLAVAANRERVAASGAFAERCRLDADRVERIMLAEKYLCERLGY